MQEMKQYWIFTHKVGSKNMYKSPLYRVVAVDGKVVMAKSHNGETIEEYMAFLVRNLKATEAHKKIVVAEVEGGGKSKTVYKWEMTSDIVGMRMKDRAEYDRKRKELKDKIAELKAELEKLDKEWYG